MYVSEKSYCHVHFSAFSPKVGNLSQPLQLAPEALKNHLNMEKKKLHPPDHSSVPICTVLIVASDASLTIILTPYRRPSTQFMSLLEHSSHHCPSFLTEGLQAMCRGKQDVLLGSDAEHRHDELTDLSSSNLVADAVQGVDHDARGCGRGVGQIVLDHKALPQ